MLFVANEFAWFFLIVLPLAWLTRPHLGVWKITMILAGLVFYGWWRHGEEDWWLLGTIPGRYCAYLLLFAVDAHDRMVATHGETGARLQALRSEGCNVLEKVDDSEYGKFGWVIDPDGNKVELWQPPEGQ